MKQYCVVSHTHWDREWYLPFEQMRWKLCALIDHCIRIMQEQPEYIFHLDAQTVVLEDYLKIRPEKAAILKQLIWERRLLVGPWYLQNDFYLSSGEATIRNLLEGRRLAEKFGACDTVGYAPDQFGCISQLPQLLRGFGIDNFIFGRGYPDELRENAGTPAEFCWRGPDGSEVLGIWLKLWYNNAQHIPSDAQKACELLKKNCAELQDSAQTQYLLLMNGVDHLEPQADVLQVLKNAGALLPADEHAAQWRLSDYVQAVKEALAQRVTPLPAYQGELRDGPDTFILKGTLSSRSYLKAANALAQTMLEQKLEPLYAMLELYGLHGAYPQDQLQYLWKKLLRNLPHDSICGCSCDEVHRRMEESYRSIQISAGDLLQRGMELAVAHLAMPGRNDGNYILAIANTTQEELDTVIEAELDLPESDGWLGFQLFDAEGGKVPFVLLSKKAAVHDCFSPLNLPGRIPVTRCRISLRTGRVQPFSIKGFLIVPAGAWQEVQKPDGAESVLENEFLRVEVRPDGSVCVLDKTTGNAVPDMFELEDAADCGDTYVFKPDPNDRPILASSFPARISVDRHDALVQQVTIRRRLLLPETYDFSRRCRSEDLVPVETALTLRLCSGVRRMEVDTQIQNTAESHRLRLLVRTGRCSDHSVADIPFDVVCRKDHALTDTCWSGTQPNTSFAALESEGRGTAVLTAGTQEYEHTMGDTLAFTLLRATQIIHREYQSLAQVGGDHWTCPENACIRTLRNRFAVIFYDADAVQARIPQLAAQFRAGVCTFFFPSDGRRFQRGRAVVQSAGVEDFFYLPDPFPGVQIPENQSAVSVNPELMVTALKKAESGDGIVLRLLNLQVQAAEQEVCGHFHAEQVRLDETPLHDAPAEAAVGSKKLRTLLLRQKSGSAHDEN